MFARYTVNLNADSRISIDVHKVFFFFLKMWVIVIFISNSHKKGRDWKELRVHFYRVVYQFARPPPDKKPEHFCVFP